MSGKIYVGNLPWSTTSSDLEAMFSPHGAVRAAEVISDRETGRSRGFGFVEMETNEGLQAAIAALNGHEINGRPLTVNEARERLRRWWRRRWRRLRRRRRWPWRRPLLVVQPVVPSFDFYFVHLFSNIKMLQGSGVLPSWPL